MRDTCNTRAAGSRMKPTIAGLVLTYNGERLLKESLASLDFCDAILVVDSCSKDATVSIAEAAGAVVIKRAWEGPAAQFRFALEHLDAHLPTDWIVSLDQDEICTGQLRANILAATAQAPDSLAGFRIPRRSWYYDRFLLHSGWYPDRLLRCFRRGRMRVSVSGAHYSFHPEGDTAEISGDILHYPYENFSQHLDKINSYAEQGAADLRARGRKGGILRGLGHGIGRFLRIYLFKAGFLDGRAGFINALHGAFYAFLKYVRVDQGSWGVPFDHR